MFAKVSQRQRANLSDPGSFLFYFIIMQGGCEEPVVPDAPWGLFELHDYADRVLCTRSSKQQQRQGGGWDLRRDANPAGRCESDLVLSDL